MKNKIIKTVGFSSILTSAILGATLFFSPYSFETNENGEIVTTIGIDVECDQVFHYLGNSENATTWSVFVEKIRPLNNDKVRDGELGSIRRCYTGGEEDFMWDEEILFVEQNKKRILSCFNYKNLFLDSGKLITEQRYNDTSEGCELAFTLKYQKEEIGWGEYLKLKFFGYYIHHIFTKNLENIKTENEKINT